MKHAVYAGTRNLYEQMVWSAKSLVANSGVDRIHLLVEDDEFPFDLPDGLFDVVNVHGFAERTFPDTGANAGTQFTKMALVRICYPELLPDVGRVLQLDVDTVVVDDVDGLWDADLEGKWFAAVPEHQGSYNPYNGEKYYNIGVAVFNVAQMAADGAQDKMVDWINTRRANCVEQDALNLFGHVYEDKAVDLPVRYNENFVCGYTDDPAIVHYAGRLDWLDSPRMPRREYLKLYRDKSWDEVLEVRNG